MKRTRSVGSQAKRTFVAPLEAHRTFLGIKSFLRITPPLALGADVVFALHPNGDASAKMRYKSTKRRKDRQPSEGLAYLFKFRVESVMDDSLFAEVESHAHFVAGMPPHKRREDDPLVDKSIKNAIDFLNQIENKISKPSVASGTTADPQTILRLYWHVRNMKKLYGVTVGFKENANCDVRWVGPGQFRNHVQNISLDDLIKLDIPRIFAEIDRRSTPYKVHPSPE